jgi:hypothetical protein
MPGPLDLAQLKNSYRSALASIQVTVLDQNGNPVVLSPDTSQGSLLQIADAMAEALFDIMKNQVQVQVLTSTPVPATPGVFPGTGTGVIE